VGRRSVEVMLDREDADLPGFRARTQPRFRNRERYQIRHGKARRFPIGLEEMRGGSRWFDANDPLDHAVSLVETARAV